MANEITTVSSLSVAKSNAEIDTGTITKQRTMTGNHVFQGTQLVLSASDAAISLGGVTSPPAELAIRNLDATNYVTLSNATGGSFAGGAFGKVVAGCDCRIQPTGAVYAKADTANVIVQVFAVDV